MVTTGKATKQERRRAHAEAMAVARLRQEQRRRLGRVLGIAAATVAIGAGVLTLVRAPDEEGSAAANVPAFDVVAGGPARSTPLAEGDAVPTFSAPGLDGSRVSWDLFAGRPAVLAVWAPWCPHCQVELPVLDAVLQEYPDVGFVSVVTAVNAQPGPTPEGYMQDEGLSFPVAMDDEAGTIATALGIEGFPTLYFIGSDGRVAVAATGEIDEATLHQVIASLT